MSAELPPAGIVVLAICGLIFLQRPRWLLPLTFVLSPFQAASAISVASGNTVIGIQPALIPGTFFCLHMILNRDWHHVTAISIIYSTASIFAVYASLSSILMPQLFNGQVLVLSPRNGIDISRLTEPAPQISNLNQSAYIIFYVTFSFLAAHEIRRTPIPSIRAYIAAIVIASFFGIYDLISYHTSLPWPSSVINSNIAYRQLFVQSIGSFHRSSSTFTEPSAAALYLSAGSVFLLIMWQRTHRRKFFALACLSISAALFTLSTTAYLTLGICLLFIVCRWAVNRGDFRNAAPAILGTALLAGVALLAIALTGIAGGTSTIIQETITEKASTVSFTNRWAADMHSAQLIAQTYTLGAGWGSNRPSSLLASILSNLGIWGALLVGGFIITLSRTTRRAIAHSRNDAHEQESRAVLSAAAYALLAIGIAGVASNPDLSTVALWLDISLVAGLAARVLQTSMPYEQPRNVSRAWQGSIIPSRRLPEITDGSPNA